MALDDKTGITPSGLKAADLAEQQLDALVDGHAEYMEEAAIAARANAKLKANTPSDQKVVSDNSSQSNFNPDDTLENHKKLVATISPLLQRAKLQTSGKDDISFNASGFDEGASDVATFVSKYIPELEENIQKETKMLSPDINFDEKPSFLQQTLYGILKLVQDVSVTDKDKQQYANEIKLDLFEDALDGSYVLNGVVYTKNGKAIARVDGQSVTNEDNGMFKPYQMDGTQTVSALENKESKLAPLVLTKDMRVDLNEDDTQQPVENSIRKTAKPTMDKIAFEDLIAQYQTKSPISRWEAFMLGTGKPPFLDDKKDAKTNGRLLRDHLGSDEKFYAYQVAKGKMKPEDAIKALGFDKQNEAVFSTSRNKETADLSQTPSLNHIKPKITLSNPTQDVDNVPQFQTGDQAEVVKPESVKKYNFVDPVTKQPYIDIPEDRIKFDDDSKPLRMKHVPHALMMESKIQKPSAEEKAALIQKGIAKRKLSTAHFEEPSKTAPIEDIEKVQFRLSEKGEQVLERIDFQANKPEDGSDSARTIGHNCCSSGTCGHHTPSKLKPA